MSDNGQNRSTVTVTIDGRQVEVPQGITILEAAEGIGIRVPHYCYHPGLSAPAQCRLCLVEVEGAPKLQPSCVTQVQDGQVVHTESEQALRMRKGVLEFYLVNHPLDCPICDQSGECKLQDYVFQEGRKHGRGREPKRVFGRDDFGGDVLFYGDRCVMCTRCVRFMEEVEEKPLLTVVERGSRSIIDTFFESGLQEAHFAGNVVDICPVGALVSKDFLHKARAWDLDHTPSVCPNCSQGCNIDLHTRDNMVQRLKPRENLEVNGHWMCDFGRHRYEWMNRGDRLTDPMARATGGLESWGWQEVLETVAGRLRELDSPSSLDVVVSPSVSNEDLGAVVALAQALGGEGGVFRSPRAAEEIPLPGFPKLRRRKDLAPNRKTAELLGMTRVGNDDGTGGLEGQASASGVLIVVGDELADVGSDFGAEAELFIHLSSYPSAAAHDNAHFVLPITTFAEQEGTFTNHEGRVQRFWPGLRGPGSARPAWLVLGTLLAALEERAPATRPAEAFARLGELHPAFSGLSYETLGTRGALVNEPAELVGGGA